MTQYSIVQQAPSHVPVGWFYYCCQWSSHTLERYSTVAPDTISFNYQEASRHSKEASRHSKEASRHSKEASRHSNEQVKVPKHKFTNQRRLPLPCRIDAWSNGEHGTICRPWTIKGSVSSDKEFCIEALQTNRSGTRTFPSTACGGASVGDPHKFSRCTTCSGATRVNTMDIRWNFGFGCS